METETDHPSVHISIDHERNKRVMRRDDDEDGGISMLSDDILLNILQCLDLRSAVTAGAVARRWRRLPRMLPNLDIGIATLVPHHRGSYLVDSVMATYANAVTWFLLPTHHRTSVHLAFYLIDLDPCLRSISDAIAAITTDRLEITVQRATDRNVQFRRRFASFLAACPTTFARLTSLALHDFSFSTASEIARLLNACHLLEFLSFTNCDCTDLVVEIDAPRSSLLALELNDCFFLGVELARVPKLERLVCDTSTFVGSMSFGFVPCLRVINLKAQPLQRYFENPVSLSPAFNSLRDVYLRKLDIPKMVWILSVLNAAPFLCNLSIKLTRPRFTSRGPYKFTVVGERPKFEHRNLSSLEIKSYGISTDMDVMDYIRLIRKHAVCLKRIHLLELCKNKCCDGVTCLCQVEDKRRKSYVTYSILDSPHA